MFPLSFSNFGSLKSTETYVTNGGFVLVFDFSNFGSLKSTETVAECLSLSHQVGFSNFGSLKSTETRDALIRHLDINRVSAISAR